MLENEAKGWHGSYSTAGRNSAEKFHMVLHMNDILTGKYKKKKIVGFFSEDNDNDLKANLEETKERDIFTEPSEKEEKLKILEQRRKLREICDPSNTKNIPERYKYHQNHHKDTFEYTLTVGNTKCSPTSTRYNPNLKYIWKKTLTGPQWDILAGREKGNIFEQKGCISKTDFYLSHPEVISGLNIVLMDKQTERGDLTNDIRIRTSKKFVKKPILSNQITMNNTSSKFRSKHLKSKKFSKQCLTEFNIPTNKYFNKTLNNINYSNNRLNSFMNKMMPTNSNSNNSNLNTITNEKKASNILKKSSSKSNCRSLSIKKNAIDFGKSLSRDQVNFVHRDKEGVRPFFTPNYHLVEPRCLTMVSYNKKKANVCKCKRIKGIDGNLFFDLDKIIPKVNNHREPTGPNFNLMMSRPDKSVLPSYMMNMHDRGSMYNITDKTLKMNNFCNVGMKNVFTSFCPKKSFNKSINLNLLKNDKYVNTTMSEFSKKISTNNEMKKLLEFYTKNLDDITTESVISKFDNVTYKTVKYNTKMSAKDKKIFDLNFGEIENKEED